MISNMRSNFLEIFCCIYLSPQIIMWCPNIPYESFLYTIELYYVGNQLEYYIFSISMF
jgi:hypothetical protein